jgi:alcohol dehydrogenase class IV
MIEPTEFELRKFVAPEFVFGIDARKLTGRYARNLGARKVLVVTDPGVMAAGWTQEVLATLEAVNLDYTVFSAVSSNPKAEEVMTGAELYRSAGCNALVVVGGGSSIDCAKGIGIVSSSGRNILEFEGVDKVELSTPPLICVPTTAGSSADVSQFAIITDKLKKVKIAIISKMIVPDVALIDPVTTTTMSAELTASTGMDALCHAVEAYVSTAHSPITDVHALQAIDLVTNNLRAAIQEPDNIIRRGRMMLASLEAGLAFSNASLGAVHAMAHSLGGFLDCPHGECNAILLPYILEYNYDAVPERYREIGNAMGLKLNGMTAAEAKSALVAALFQFAESVGVTYTLGSLGVKRSDLPELAEKAIDDPCIFTNPRQMERQDIEAIYEKAL